MSSVGKISLDLDLKSDISKQINSVASKMGAELTKSLRSTLNTSTKGINPTNLAKGMSNALKKATEESFKGAQDVIDSSMTSLEDRMVKTINTSGEAFKKSIAENEKAAESAIDNIEGRLKKMKGPSLFGKLIPNRAINTGEDASPSQQSVMPKKTFEMPKKTYSTQPIVDENSRLSQSLDNVNQQIDIQQQKLNQLKQEYNSGLSESTKHEIEQQNQVMAAAEHRIEALRIKLKDLKFSYENAVNPDRENKLLQEIAKTEAQMTTLISRSDNALHKINQLEDGLSGEKRNALRERIVKAEAALLNLGNRAQKIRGDLDGAGKSMQRVGASATKTEKPVRRLGLAFFRTGKQSNVMGNQFVAAFQRIAKQVFVFALLYKAIRGFQNYIGGALRTNDQFMHSLNQVKTNLQVAFMPIFQAILPALQAFMNWLAKATAYIAAFISAIFGKTYQQSFQAAQGINSARNAMDGFGGSAKKAAKEAEKANKQLAGFDEINTIGDNAAGSDAGGAGGGGGGAGGIAPLTPPDMDITGIQAKMDNLVAGIKNTFGKAWDFVKKGWDWTIATFGPSLSIARGHISAELLKWKGTFSRMFTDIMSLGEPFSRWVIDHVVPLYQKGIEIMGEIFAGFLETSRFIFESVWDSIFPIIQLFVTDGLPVLTDFVSGALDIFYDLFMLTKGIFDDIWMDVVDPVLKLISKIIQDGLSLIFDWWNNWGTELIKNIRGFLSGVKELWETLWNGFLQPFISNMLDMLTDLWNEHIRDVVREIGNLVGKLITSATEILNKFILPIVNWLTKTLGPIFQVVFSGIGGFVSSVIGSIVDVIGGLIKILSGLIDFLTGAFTGNWRKAWSGLVDIFRGIASTLGTILKAPLNGIIGLVNGAIRGLNKIKIPSWVPGLGGKGINIPQIPKLARGGIVDQPTIAMVGEAGKEAVMPLENNTGWINNLAGQIAGQIGGGQSNASDESVTILREIVDVLLQILNALMNNDSETVIKVGETELGKVVAKALNNLSRQTGKSVIEV